MSEKCPKCKCSGSPKYSNEPNIILYSCGSVEGLGLKNWMPFSESEQCLRNQLVQKEAEIEQLQFNSDTFRDAAKGFEKEIERLRGLLGDTLTADGVEASRRMKLYHPDCCWANGGDLCSLCIPCPNVLFAEGFTHNAGQEVCETFKIMVSDCYSTREAAEGAKEGAK